MSPVILVDGNGHVCASNPAGATCFEEWLALAEARDRAPIVSANAMILASLRLGCLCWVAMESSVLKITPIASGGAGEPAGLLEWLPTSGPDAGRETLQIFQEVSRAVNSSLIMEDIFEALGEVLRAHIPYQEAAIVILDNTQNGIKTLVRMFEDGELEITGEHNAFAGYEPLVDRILREPFSHLYSRSALPSSFLLTENAASALVVPLINKGAVIGLIAMSTSAEGGFYHYQEELLTEVSAQLAVAVENAKFYWQTQAQASREFLINQLTHSIRQSLDIDIILGTAVTELGKVLGVSRCFIRYFPPNEQEKAFQYQLPGIRRLSLDELDYEKGVFELRREQTYNPFVLNDIRDCPPQLDSQGQLQHSDVKSLAIFPILIRDELVGTITLHQCDAYRAWVMEDLELLRALAEHLGVALHQAQLFLALEQQKTALEQTLEELQQAQLYLIQSEKMAVLGQFVAGIAHEVNTPLGTIISNNATLKVCVDKLRHMADHPDSDPLFTGVENLLSLNKLASSRIQDIVKNLRNFARLDESELKVVDLRDGIDSTILLVQSSLDSKVAIVRQYGPDVPPIRCYPGLLNQVFMNLLVNANHAIQDVAVQRADHAITIETGYSAQTDAVTVTIRDTGKGIPPENLTKVFDPGFTTKGAGVGTGLGLALCYRIVEKHHGRISLESVVNEGTCFRVEIPAHTQAAPS